MIGPHARRGMRLALDPEHGCRADLRAQIADPEPEMMDADAADVVVQYGCFGEIVYG